MDKILNILNNNLKKYDINDENYKIFDSLLREIEEVRVIVAKKYLKIGKALDMGI